MAGNAEIKSTEVTMYPDGRLDTKNASVYLGSAPKTLAMHRSNGTGPKYVKRGRVFYFKDDLDAWLQEGRATSTAQSRTRLALVKGGNKTVGITERPA